MLTRDAVKYSTGLLSIVFTGGWQDCIYFFGSFGLQVMSDLQQAAVAEKEQGGFSQFGLSSEILKALADLGYKTPTPIQSKAIPYVLEGKDVMGAAQTGTGKTAGYSLPVLQSLLYFANTSVSPARHPVRMLVLVPTRELADQVYEDIKNYAKYTTLRVAVVFGGIDMSTQTGALRAGCEVLIATPGRLLDHVQQKNVSLNQTQVLVLDEADRMLDMGFMPDLQRIVSLLPKQRQNLLFSATFTDEIRKLAKQFLTDPVSVEVARKNATADTVQQIVYHVADDDKGALVEFLLKKHPNEQTLIFTNTKLGASRLARWLERRGGIKASAIHGDRTQQERMAVLESFRNGEVNVLVATDVAARGLHIEDLPFVINFELPYVAEDYVHRIGRTGRAGAQGTAVSFYTDKDTKLLAEIEKLTRKKLSPVVPEGFNPREYAMKPGGHAGRYERPELGPYHSVGLMKKKSEDPWFDRPYEPETQTGAKPSSPVKSKEKPLAFLLGGGPKKTE